MKKTSVLTLPPINRRNLDGRRKITLKPLEKPKVLLPPAWCNSILNWETIYSQQLEFTNMLNKIEYHASLTRKRVRSLG